jgi:hypothetical protein
MKHNLTTSHMISINDLRRKFGEVERTLPFVSHFVVTKKGKPFAILSATPESKKELMKRTAGSFKGTGLDNELIWKDVSIKKSRQQPVKLYPL